MDILGTLSVYIASAVRNVQKTRKVEVNIPENRKLNIEWTKNVNYLKKNLIGNINFDFTALFYIENCEMRNVLWLDINEDGVK